MLLSQKLLAAALAAGLFGVPAVDASAHPHPARGSGAHGHRHAPKANRLTHAQRTASRLIAVRQKAVHRLAQRTASLQLADGPALTDALTADATALQADADAVAAAGSVHDLHILVRSSATTWRVASAQFRGVRSSDRSAATADDQSDLVAELTAALDALVTGDPADGDADLSDALAQLTTLATDVSDIVSQLLALSPTASSADLHAALQAVGTTLDALPDLLSAIADDISSVLSEYGLQAP